MIRSRALLASLFLIIAAHASAQTTEWRDPSPHKATLVTVDENVQLEVLDWGGTGPTVLLLAGLGATAHSYDDFALLLAKRYHVIGVSRRAHGKSSAPATGYTAQRLAEDVVRVMDAVGMRRGVVVGHSFAGEELHVLGDKYADRIAGLVYIDAAFNRADGARTYDSVAATMPRAPSPQPSDLASFASLRAFIEKNQGPMGPEAHLRATYLTNPDGTPGRQWAPDAPVRQALSIEMRAWSTAYNPAHIRVPALAIYAVPKSASDMMRPWYDANDATIRPRVETLFRLSRERFDRHAKWFAAFSEQGKVAEIPGGHFLFITHPPEVLRHMETFISSLPASR